MSQRIGHCHRHFANLTRHAAPRNSGEVCDVAIKRREVLKIEAGKVVVSACSREHGHQLDACSEEASQSFRGIVDDEPQP